IKKHLNYGWMYVNVNNITIELSEKIQDAVPVAENIRYVTSGTEATMYAVRLARTVTRKNIIAKIDGGWHGYTSDLLKTVNWPFGTEGSGLVTDKKIVSLPLNNLKKSFSILDSIKPDLAGVIIEPVLGGGGSIPATKDYLYGIQQYVHKNNSLFILDEIVTGFRFRYGCLYQTMNLDPDIVTLGKIVGGGFPIGVICGKKEIMEYANTRTKTKEKRSYIGGGTFSANPVSMTAGSSTLSVLKKKKNALYEKINGFGTKARKEIDKVFAGKTITTGIGSLFLTHFVKNDIDKIQNAADAAMCDVKLLHKYHFDMIANDGIFFLPGKLGAFSDAHSQTDVKELVLASTRFSQNIIK
ncbi:MAG: aminotransferase class III-fold pyridoxal phosphate-dependent enzyme, partial [Nitrosopumilaceae archaeon]